MNYDFIEVGTSDFDTLTQDATDNCIGLCIEPIKFYLDRLPNKPNVKKINSAISFDGKVGRDRVYYIPLKTIQKHNMPLWLRGCNSMGDYHYQHKKNNLQSVVETVDVDTIPLGDIFEQYNVDTLTILKIDTEGGDCFILNSFIPFLESNEKQRWPLWIEFETNILTPKGMVGDTIQKYCDLGYTVARRGVGEQNSILKSPLCK